MPRRRRSRKGAKKALLSSIKGHRINVGRTPPAFNPCPWYPLTIAMSLTAAVNATAVSCVTINQVLKAWQQQTGLSVVPHLCVRFQTIRAWDVSGQPINIAVDVLPDGTQCSSYSDTAGVIEAYPGKAAYAAGGYVWPLSSRQQTKTAAEGSTVVCRVSLPKSSKVLLYINVLWSFGTSVVPDNIDSSVTVETLKVRHTLEETYVVAP